MPSTTTRGALARRQRCRTPLARRPVGHGTEVRRVASHRRDRERVPRVDTAWPRDRKVARARTACRRSGCSGRARRRAVAGQGARTTSMASSPASRRARGACHCLSLRRRARFRRAHHRPAYSERRALLDGLELDNVSAWYAVRRLRGSSATSSKRARATTSKGVVAKRVDAPYRAGERCAEAQTQDGRLAHRPRITAVPALDDVGNCRAGLILHADGTVARCTEDDEPRRLPRPRVTPRR